MSRGVHAGTYIPKWLELLVSDAWTVVCGGHRFPAVKDSTAAGPWVAPPWCLLPSACLRSHIYELLPSAVARTPSSSQGPLSSQAPRVLLGTAETGTHCPETYCPGCWGHTLGTDCRGHTAWDTGDILPRVLGTHTGDRLLGTHCPGTHYQGTYCPGHWGHTARGHTPRGAGDRLPGTHCLVSVALVAWQGTHEVLLTAVLGVPRGMRVGGGAHRSPAAHGTLNNPAFPWAGLENIPMTSCPFWCLYSSAAGTVSTLCPPREPPAWPQAGQSPPIPASQDTEKRGSPEAPLPLHGSTQAGTPTPGGRSYGSAKLFLARSSCQP